MVYDPYQILLAMQNPCRSIQIMQRYADSYASSNPEICWEQIGAKDGPAQPENMWSAPPWISTVRAEPEHEQAAGAGAGAKDRRRSRTGGGGTETEPRGAESWLGLRAAADSITNNLTAGIPEPCPQISKNKAPARGGHDAGWCFLFFTP